MKITSAVRELSTTNAVAQGRSFRAGIARTSAETQSSWETAFGTAERGFTQNAHLFNSLDSQLHDDETTVRFRTTRNEHEPTFQ